MNLDQAEAASEVTKSAISRLENALGKIKPVYVRALTRAYGLDDGQVESLVDLAKQCEKRGWWTSFSETLSAEEVEYIAFENDASLCRSYEVAVVDGLLQTEAYTRAVMQSAVQPGLSDAEIENRVSIRMKRADVLEGEQPLDLWTVVEESALRKPTGGHEVMLEELQHLLDLSRRPNITIQVMPSSIGVHPGIDGAFHILSFDDPRVGEVVYVGTPVGELYAEEEHQIRRCEVTFDHLKATALGEEQSRELIRKIIDGKDFYRS